MSKCSVCHITSVHRATDVRIFHRECVTLAGADYQVHLVVLNGESGIADGIRIHGVQAKYSSRLYRATTAQDAIFNKAKETGAGIFHLHDPELLRLAGRLRKLGRVIYDAHEDLPRQILSKSWVPSSVAPVFARLVERWEDRKVSHVDAVIAATDHIADRFRPMNRVYVVKNYPLKPTQEPLDFRERLNQVCYVGGITAARGVKEMVAAAGQAGAALHLAGPIDPPALENELQQMKAWGAVIYRGFVGKDEVEKIIAKSLAGLVVLHDMPSYREALPVKMFEYMAAGTPVIASDFALWREIVGEADAGLLIPPGDILSLSEAISYLSKDKKKAAEMGRNGYRAVMEKYNWSLASQELLSCYQSL